MTFIIENLLVAQDESIFFFAARVLTCVLQVKATKMLPLLLERFRTTNTHPRRGNHGAGYDYHHHMVTITKWSKRRRRYETKQTPTCKTRKKLKWKDEARSVGRRVPLDAAAIDNNLQYRCRAREQEETQ